MSLTAEEIERLRERVHRGDFVGVMAGVPMGDLLTLAERGLKVEAMLEAVEAEIKSEDDAANDALGDDRFDAFDRHVSAREAHEEILAILRRIANEGK